MTDRTFVRITNREIYSKLESIEDKINKTNGKVKLNRWIATTGLSIILATLIGLAGSRVIRLS